MKRIYAADNLMMVGFLKETLESEGFDCFIKNELLAGGAGELPLTECWPELWIVDDRHVARVRERVREILNAESRIQPAWRCEACGESLEGQFAQCWRCGSVRGDKMR